MSEQRPLLVLMDGHAVAYRAYFAMNARGFTTDSGEPTNATFGFTRALMDILDMAPDYFAISFDMGLSGRETVFPDYKGTREKMPDDLAIQLGRIDQVVRAFNIPVLAVPGYEADDVIGTITRQAEEQGCEVLILTGDRDILQLLSQHTRVQLPQRGDDDKIWGVADFQEAWGGLTPLQLIDLKGIMGDNSDNIPGVKGIGEKGAINLISTYGSLEGVYEHLDEIKGKQREYLERDREIAFLSKSLATILQDVPIELNLEACVTHDYDAGEVVKIFREVQFRQLMSRLEKMHLANPEEAILLDLVQLEEVVIVDTPAKLTALAETLNQAQWIAFDTETTGLRPMEAKLVGISLAVDGEHGYYIPLGHISPSAPEGMVGGVNADGTINQTIRVTKTKQAGLFDTLSETDNLIPPQLSLQSVIEAIRPALTDPEIPKMAHNADFDLMMMRRYGIDVQPIHFDTMIAQWVRYPDSRNLGLKALVSTKLKKSMQEIETLIGRGAKQISFARVPIDQAAPYATADAAMLHLLRPQLDAEFETDQMRELFHTLEMPLVPLIADMEMTGVLLDVPYLKDMSLDLNERNRKLQQEIYEACGCGEFNINSMHQLNDVLFKKLQLTPPKNMKQTKKTGNWSLTADMLEEMAGMHPALDLILEYRRINKLISTYVDALPALINPDTGRVHTSYNQTGAVTGRFSSNDPNLQNIPIRTEEGRRVRKAFIADKGNVLLSVDYSQIELRILAHFSNDEAMLTAFREGADIHRRTAASVFHIAPEDVTFEQRSFAKSVNFGLMYGMSAFRLANDAGISRTAANQFVEEYFAQFPGVKAYLDGSKAWANEKGYVETLFGRRRYFPELLREGSDKVTVVQRQRQEREAINAPIQGTAADLLKMAMLNLDAELKREGYPAKLILQVHDELVLEVAESHLDAVLPVVKEVMENVYMLKAPLLTESKIGVNWYDMQKI